MSELHAAQSEPRGAPQAHPLLATKLFIPRLRADLVPRPRLTARLNEGLRRRLTLISAPAGTGKSTLLGEWVRGLAAGRRRVDGAAIGGSVAATARTIVLLSEWCKGCGICIAFCPRQVLAAEPLTGLVRAERPEECNGCRRCEMLCPDFAIAVEER